MFIILVKTFQIKILKLSYRKVAIFEMYHFSINGRAIYLNKYRHNSIKINNYELFKCNS